MPTIKQKKAFKAVVSGSTLTQAMKDVGYSEETSKRTNKLTATVGWKELMEKHLPDDTLAQVHHEGLKAGSKIIIDGKDTGIVVPDYSVRHKYLDTAYKLKGSYAPEKSINVDVQISTEGLEELRGLAKTVNESIKQTYGSERPDTEKTS